MPRPLPSLNINLCLSQRRGASSSSAPAKCVWSAACCGPAWRSTTRPWHRSTATSTSDTAPRTWTFLLCFENLLKKRPTLCKNHRRESFSVCLVSEQIKWRRTVSQPSAVCVPLLFKSESVNTGRMLQAFLFFFYLYICEYTANIPPTWRHVTVTQTDAHTEQLRRVHSKASWMRNRLRRDGSGWGRLWLNSVTQPQ